MIPEVSVVMSAFNAEETIGAALDSLYRQTFRNIEVIVLDDGSTDNTRNIVKNYPDPRIQLITSSENIGLAGRLNQGIAEARGQFIARMDADDVCDPDRIAVQIAFLKSNPDISFCGSWARSTRDGSIIRFPLTHREITTTLFINCAFCHPSVMWRHTPMLQNLMQYDTTFSYAQDYDLWVRAVEFCEMANISRPLMTYDDSVYDPTSAKGARQRELAWGVQCRQVNRLGNWDETELKRHRAAIQFGWELNRDVIERNVVWLDKLGDVNRRKRLYFEPEFSATLGMHVLFNLMIATQAGINCLDLYKRTALCHYRPMTGRDRLKKIFFSVGLRLGIKSVGGTT